MLSILAAFVIGVLVGAFSHKWLAAEASKVGVNPQAVADQAKAKVESVVGGSSPKPKA